MLLLRGDYLENLAWFTSMASLQDPYAFTDSEMLFELFRIHFDLDWNFVQCLNYSHLLLVYRFNDTCAILELATDHFASISNLDLKLNIVSDCLKDCIILHHVPLILIRIICSSILLQQVRI